MVISTVFVELFLLTLIFAFMICEPTQMNEIGKAADIIRNGGVVIFPTETVYGLGANALNPDSVGRIYEIKNRPSTHPLIVHVGSIESALELVENLPPLALILMKKFWPGPLSLVLKKSKKVPDSVTGNQPTVAIRMPKHSLALSLLNQTGLPIAAPSANLFGQLSPTRVEHLSHLIKEKVGAILDGGPCEVGLESTILQVEGDRLSLLRPGGISRETIEKEIGVTLQANPLAPRVSGSLKDHYSPKKPLYLKEDVSVWSAHDRGVLLFSSHPSAPLFGHSEVLSPSENMEEAARNLYKALYLLDQSPVKEIIAQKPPTHSLGEAILDRLTKASRKS
jgi:L-threonylcarbamoyladenylate synthase